VSDAVVSVLTHDFSVATFVSSPTGFRNVSGDIYIGSETHIGGAQPSKGFKPLEGSFYIFAVVSVLTHDFPFPTSY
jgi:hypothetical protein